MPGRIELAAGALSGLLLAGVVVPAEPPPDAGFLEFLGMLVEDDGLYLDPLDMAAVDWPDRETDGDDQAAATLPDEQERPAGDAALEKDDEDD